MLVIQGGWFDVYLYPTPYIKKNHIVLKLSYFSQKNQEPEPSHVPEKQSESSAIKAANHLL